MKNIVSKLLVVSAIAIGSTPAMAADLNVMCNLLNRSLPGKALLATGLSETDKYDLSQNVQITSSKKGVLKIKAKGGATEAKLVNIGSGESSTCLLSLEEDGIQGELVDMDLDKNIFTFVESGRGIKLVIIKK